MYFARATGREAEQCLLYSSIALEMRNVILVSLDSARDGDSNGGLMSYCRFFLKNWIWKADLGLDIDIGILGVDLVEYIDKF